MKRLICLLLAAATCAAALPAAAATTAADLRADISSAEQEVTQELRAMDETVSALEGSVLNDPKDKERLLSQLDGLQRKQLADVNELKNSAMRLRDDSNRSSLFETSHGFELDSPPYQELAHTCRAGTGCKAEYQGLMQKQRRSGPAEDLNAVLVIDSRIERLASQIKSAHRTLHARVKALAVRGGRPAGPGRARAPLTAF